VREVLLQRMGYLEFGTFGRLHLPDGHIIYTVERPWLRNERGISCIPEGDYTCRPSRYHRGGYDAIEVMDVPDRSRILIHIGNWPADVQGCIAVGERIECIDGKLGVTNSKATFHRLLMPQLGHAEFTLAVRRPQEAKGWAPSIG